MSEAQKTPQSSDPVGDELENTEKEFKPVKTGEPIENSHSKIDKDPFTVLLETRKYKDKARCEAWKDEVQNLLIFAGLFSAVVTAFIIESYKGLKDDSGDVANDLLRRILTQLEGSTNGTTTQSPTTPTFTPSPTAIRINILWFLSLIFSLATVLVGIIALQWLREHLRPQSHLEPQIAFSLHYLNVKSLDRWYLPQIFTALPLLLQVGLVLFLAGIVDFLWSLNHTVAVPVAIAVGFSLFFLLWTTVLPTVQALCLLLPPWPWATKPRSPCAYRSPQSWAFYQLLRPLVAILLTIFDHTNIERSTDWGHRGLESHTMIMENDRKLYLLETTSDRERRPTNLIFRHEIGDTWATLGIAWLFQRDLDFMRQNKEFEELDLDADHRPVPVFDTVRALIDVGASGSLYDVSLAHKCVESVVHANKSDMDYMNYLTLLVDLTGDISLPDSQEEVSLDTLAHHSTVFFHCGIVGSRQPESVPKSVVELFANTTHTLFADSAKPLVDIWLARSSPLFYFNFGYHPEGQEQLLDILNSYFRNAATYHPKPEDAGKAIYFSSVGASFIFHSALSLPNLKPTSSLFSRYEGLLQSLTTSLQDLPDDLTTHPPPDYLFFASLLYVRLLLAFDSDKEIVKTDACQNLILSMLQYRARVPQLRKDIEESFYNTVDTFEEDWPDFVQSANELGIVLPPPAMPPSDPPPLEGTEIQEITRQVSGDAIVDVQVEPLGKPSSKDAAPGHSSLEMADEDATA